MLTDLDGLWRERRGFLFLKDDEFVPYVDSFHLFFV